MPVSGAESGEAIPASPCHGVPYIQIWPSRARKDHRVVVENVWLHALTLGTEPHMGSAIEERFANGGELRRVAPFDGFTRLHGRWPPRRIHQGQI